MKNKKKNEKKKKDKLGFISPVCFAKCIIATFEIPQFFYDLRDGKYNNKYI